MKIGLIADIHGNAPALMAVMSALRERVEKILFLGDLAGYYYYVNECAAIWGKDRFIGIRGNHDNVLLQCINNNKAPDSNYRIQYGSGLERSWQSLSEDAYLLVQSLPVERHLNLESVSVLLCHGAPWNPLEERIYPDFNDWNRFVACKEDIILLGHSHYQMVKRYKGKLIINPGSVGQPRDGSIGACYAELDLPSGNVEFHAISYDTSSIIEDSLRYDPDNKYLVEVFIH